MTARRAFLFFAFIALTCTREYFSCVLILCCFEKLTLVARTWRPDADDTSDMVMPAGPPVKWTTDHALITIAALLQSITTTTSVALEGALQPRDSRQHIVIAVCCLPRQASRSSPHSRPATPPAPDTLQFVESRQSREGCKVYVQALNPDGREFAVINTISRNGITTRAAFRKLAGQDYGSGRRGVSLGSLECVVYN